MRRRARSGSGARARAGSWNGDDFGLRLFGQDRLRDGLGSSSELGQHQTRLIETAQVEFNRPSAMARCDAVAASNLLSALASSPFLRRFAVCFASPPPPGPREPPPCCHGPTVVTHDSVSDSSLATTINPLAVTAAAPLQTDRIGRMIPRRRGGVVERAASGEGDTPEVTRHQEVGTVDAGIAGPTEVRCVGLTALRTNRHRARTPAAAPRHATPPRLHRSNQEKPPFCKQEQTSKSSC